MQINNIGQLFKALRTPLPTHKPAVPSPSATPKPERSKVVAIPTRTPINRQTAMVIRPANCWAERPLPPEKLPNPHQEELDKVRADLKIERNAHAATRDELGTARSVIRELKHSLARQEKLVASLRAELLEKAEIIRQLEDLKL